MATGLLETGPKLDWTRDNKIFDCYQIWKEKVELIFSSALEESSAKQKVYYLRYWMGEQGIPLIKKWTALGKLDFSNPVEVPATEGARRIPLSSGYILQNYWDLLEAEFRPKGNKLLSVIELWTRSRQGSKTLNEWLTYVYNLVESCNYGDSSERIIRDVLIIDICEPDAVPAKHRPRKVPVHLQDAFHEEVERLVKIDVLEKVTEPTEWVNSFVIVEKMIDSSNAHSPNHSIKKSIHLCIDPKDLNEALEREPYYSRTIDELISMFAGAKVFTIVDMDKGYWQVVLHPESRKLTCMAFDIERYQFKRLPMGSKVASNIFQRMLDSVYIGLPGVTGIADDMDDLRQK